MDKIEMSVFNEAMGYHLIPIPRNFSKDIFNVELEKCKRRALLAEILAGDENGF